MPIKLSNVNFFILQRSFPFRFAAMARPRDFAVSPKSCRLLPLSSESPGYLVAGVADAGAPVSDQGYNT